MPLVLLPFVRAPFTFVGCGRGWCHGCRVGGATKRVAAMRHFLNTVYQGFKQGGLARAFQEVKKEGLWNCIRDGNLLAAKLWADKDATLVGIDKFGNKYFEKKTAQTGRSRWVEYADKTYYDASNVPPEWHGWLHYITDHTADQLESLKPARYGLEHKPNQTGEGEQYIYHSKGHALSPNQRDWTRYNSWRVPESGSK